MKRIEEENEPEEEEEEEDEGEEEAEDEGEEDGGEQEEPEKKKTKREEVEKKNVASLTQPQATSGKMCGHKSHVEWWGGTGELGPQEVLHRSSKKCERCFARCKEIKAERQKKKQQVAPAPASAQAPQLQSPTPTPPPPPISMNSPAMIDQFVAVSSSAAQPWNPASYNAPRVCAQSLPNAALYCPLAPSWSPSYPPRPPPAPPVPSDATAASRLPRQSPDPPPGSFPAPVFLATLDPSGKPVPPVVRGKPSLEPSPMSTESSAAFQRCRESVRRLEEIVGEGVDAAAGAGRPQALKLRDFAREVSQRLETFRFKAVADFAYLLRSFWMELFNSIPAGSKAEERAKALQAELEKWVTEEVAKEAIAAATRPAYQPDESFGTTADACTACGELGDLLYCPGPCRRCFHEKCLGPQQSRSFLAHKMCSECFRGRPVLHYDPTRRDFFYYRCSAPENAGRAEEDRARFSALYSHQPQSLKSAMRKLDETHRPREMFYDAVWCTWRPKAPSVQAARKERHDHLASLPSEPPQLEQPRQLNFTAIPTATDLVAGSRTSAEIARSVTS